MDIDNNRTLLIQHLDLFTEYCLQCETILTNLRNEHDAGIMRDSADLNILLYQFLKRRSVLDKILIKGCIESWSVCLITLSNYDHDSTFNKCYELSKTCINDFNQYI